ncbi:hypothetical protein ACTWPT_39490 [Nonomuraea sp. 3N208]|uniref:hypothetical protein n=1 Tax=Nonomuraea sp. 3N208 TaxID=3457421 RepID=UPI003FD2D23B
MTSFPSMTRGVRAAGAPARKPDVRHLEQDLRGQCGQIVPGGGGTSARREPLGDLPGISHGQVPGRQALQDAPPEQAGAAASRAAEVALAD